MRYTFPNGVVVECSEEVAEKIAGLKPAGSARKTTRRTKPEEVDA